MKSLQSHSVENVVIGLAGFSGAVTIGALFSGSMIFNWQSPAFQYLIFGAGTSALFVGWKEKGLLESTTWALAFALYCAIPTRDHFFHLFLNAALFFLFAVVAFQLTWKPIEHRLPFGKFLILGLAFALFELVKTAAMMYSFPQEQLLRTSILNATLRGTMGLGVGAGIEIAQYVLQALFHHTHK